MEAMVDALKFFGAKSHEVEEIRKELRGLNRDAGRQLGTLLKAIHLFEEDEAGFSHMRAARLRTNLITREGIPSSWKGCIPYIGQEESKSACSRNWTSPRIRWEASVSLDYATASYDCGISGLERLDLSGNHSHIEGAREHWRD